MSRVTLGSSEVLSLMVVMMSGWMSELGGLTATLALSLAPLTCSGFPEVGNKSPVVLMLMPCVFLVVYCNFLRTHYSFLSGLTITICVFTQLSLSKRSQKVNHPKGFGMGERSQ